MLDIKLKYAHCLLLTYHYWCMGSLEQLLKCTVTATYKNKLHLPSAVYKRRKRPFLYSLGVPLEDLNREPTHFLEKSWVIPVLRSVRASLDIVLFHRTELKYFDLAR